jgi:transposase
MASAYPAMQRPPARVADDGWRIPDALWERIEPRLPPRKPHPLACHSPRVPDRRAMDATFFVLRTACEWGAWTLLASAHTVRLNGASRSGSRRTRGRCAPR